MLEKIILKNFQIHEYIEIDFDPRVTSFVGLNDTGKSTILRGIEWICLNQAPKDFINWDADYAEGEIIIDGHSIRRRRGKGPENTYTLDGKQLEAFGKGGVPEEVAKLVNMTDSNFQMPHDPIFWFMDTSGQVSKKLNAIFNLEIIDRTQANLLSETRRAKAEVEVSKQRLTQAEQDRENLAWVPEMYTDLQSLEAKKTDLVANAHKCDSLRVLLQEASNSAEAARNATKAKLDAEKLLVRAKSLYETTIQVKKLRILLTETKELGETVCQMKKQIGEGETALKRQLAKNCPLCKRALS